MRHDAQCELRCVTSNSGDDEALYLSPVYPGAVPSFKKQRFSARLALVTRKSGLHSSQRTVRSDQPRWEASLKQTTERRSTANMGNV